MGNGRYGKGWSGFNQNTTARRRLNRGIEKVTRRDGKKEIAEELMGPTFAEKKEAAAQEANQKMMDDLANEQYENFLQSLEEDEDRRYNSSFDDYDPYYEEPDYSHFSEDPWED